MPSLVDEDLTINLNGKTVVVTGGAGLIGREFVKAIAKSGGRGIIADINFERALQVTKELKRELGMNVEDSFVEAAELDIKNKISIEKLIEGLCSKFGKIDALVNCAYPRNANYGRKFFEVEYKDFCENVSENLGGYFLCSQCFAKYFTEEADGGNIINIASIYGVIAPRFEIYEGTSVATMPVEYAAIKSGLIHMTKYLAKYLKGKKIRVNCISPGGVEDQQSEDFKGYYSNLCCNDGMLKASDLSGTLLFLLSDMSRSINGQNIIVDNGFTL